MSDRACHNCAYASYGGKCEQKHWDNTSTGRVLRVIGAPRDHVFRFFCVGERWKPVGFTDAEWERLKPTWGKEAL